MNSAQFQRNVLAKIDSQAAKLEELQRTNEFVCAQLRSLTPTVQGYRIPKPPQSIIGRDPNPAKTFRSLINDHNHALSKDDARYLIQFPAKWTNEQVNTEAKRCLEGLMTLELKDG